MDLVSTFNLNNVYNTSSSVTQLYQRQLRETSTNYYEENKNWILGLSIAMAVQIFLGLLAIEYALSATSRMRDVDEKRD